jgi:catechol 2,3-dioxygenase-like lactoylglutathione lyase family enzyme
VPPGAPFSDVDRAIAFYRDQVGFALDHDTRAGEMRFAQLTPPGSGCSIVLGDLPGGSAMQPGSLKGLQLVVCDAYRARAVLSPASGRCPHSHGVAAGDIDVIDERDGGTLFGFTDPDGNSWVVQQIEARA